MQNRYTLPLISALVVAASLASCQRKAEEVTTPAEEIVFTVGSPSRTKAAVAAGSSSVKTPVKASSGEEFTLEVSSCPWMVEEPSTPATKVTPLDASYFSTSHNSFGVMTYSASSEGAAAASRTLSWTDEAVYNGGIWAPSTSRAWPFAGNYLTFFGWAPYDAVTPSDNSGVPVISDFTVETAAADQVDLLVSGKVESTDSPLVSGICVPVTFGHALTAVKFVEENLTINSVTISGIYDKGSYNMDTGEWSDQSTGGQTYSLTSDVTEESSTLMLIPQTLPSDAILTAQTSKGSITASLAGQVWEAGKAVTYRLTASQPPFSVSDTLKVRFSPGNLQAVFDNAGSTCTWKFAPNQWSYVGNAAANTRINGDGSVNAAGTVDLFGWSTAATKYGINNSASSIYSGDFVDWGSAVASTLGSGWRTLSLDEWVWLLGETYFSDPGENCRTSSTVSGTENARYCKARVNSVSGLVIFPDYYTHPSDVTDPASVNVENAAFNSNSWSGTEWAAMEAAGCVFLPAAGYRDGTSVKNVGSNGRYWSSTPNLANSAYRLYFYSSDVSPENHILRYYGYSVRLVQYL